MRLKEVTFPTWLTLARLILSPLLLPFLLVTYLPLNDLHTNIVLAVIFSIFSLTDFFDGYLARRYCQETLLGKILDPIADKFLVYSTLISLLAIGKIYYYWVVVLIGREFFVMGLRLIALEYNFSIPVSAGGKLKTCFQMAFLLFTILNPYQQLGFADAEWWNGTEVFLLFMTLLFSLTSAWEYYQSGTRRLFKVLSSKG